MAEDKDPIMIYCPYCADRCVCSQNQKTHDFNSLRIGQLQVLDRTSDGLDATFG